MDAGARTSFFLCQINRRACGGRPMTAAAARARRRVLCATRGGLGDVSSSTRVRSETLVQRCVLVTVPPPFCCVCPRSVNQALRLSTRWMFGRVNRMVVIGRFGCVFWCEGGWWRTPIRAGQAQRAPMRRVACCSAQAMPAVSARVKLRVAARARDRALFAAAVDAYTSDSSLPALSSRCRRACGLKLASGCKTLASGRTAVGVSEDLSLAANGSL